MVTYLLSFKGIAGLGNIYIPNNLPSTPKRGGKILSVSAISGYDVGNGELSGVFGSTVIDGRLPTTGTPGLIIYQQVASDFTAETFLALVESDF